MGKIKEIVFDSNGRLAVAETYDKGQKLVIHDGQTGERMDHSDPSINARHAIIKFSDDTKLLAVSDEQRRQFRIYPHDSDRLASLAERYVHRKLSSTECGQYLQNPNCPPLP